MAKKIFLVFIQTKDNKNFAIAESVKAGENLMPIIDRYKSKVCHICETATQAHILAVQWNEDFKNNGTYLYSE